MTRLARLSHGAFAVMLIALGALSFWDRAFAVIWDPYVGVPPLKTALFALTAAISVLAGIGLLIRPLARNAAWLILVLLLAWLIVVRLPQALAAPGIGTIWPCSKVAVIAAAAWVISNPRRLRMGHMLYGVALVPFGLAHFLYVQQTAVLIPTWLIWPLGWACATGAALIVAGTAIVIGKFARPAAMLSALEMALIGLIVWLPRVITGGLGEFQRGETVITLALSIAAWVVADSYVRNARA